MTQPITTNKTNCKTRPTTRACTAVFYDGLEIIPCDHRGKHTTTPHVNTAHDLLWTSGS